MIQPAATQVFAVGITSYKIGRGWRLPNAAEHALAFAAWARARGVPKNQVHLFLSSADHERLAAAAAEADVDMHEATFTAITDFTDRVLTARYGELLYMFWAGHGSMSEHGRRVLFFESLTQNTQRAFELNDFFARLRTSSFQRFGRQIAFVDACANRFEELGFAASLGEDRAGKGRYAHGGVRQAFFLAADSGEQAQEGDFGKAVLAALADASRQSEAWPPDQDAIVNAVRPQFEKPGQRQHPIQLVWTTATGDQHSVEFVSGELPASRSVNAAAFIRRLPVRALRRLADIAVSFAQLGDDKATGAAERDALYAALCRLEGRAVVPLPRSTPAIEMLHLVGAALQWNKEAELADELGQLAPAAEFSVELVRWALIQIVRPLVEQLQQASLGEVHDEYLKTISALSNEEARQNATTIDAMLDELFQISNAHEPEFAVWEFLLRLAERFPAHRQPIDQYLAAKAPAVTLTTLRQKLLREQQFVLSIHLKPSYDEKPAIAAVEALLAKEGTSTVVHAFRAQDVANWEQTESVAIAIVRKAREIVMDRYRLDEGALLVEFLMPSDFLTQAPDRLAFKLPAGSSLLGQRHAVVVRLRERSLQPSYAINLDTWTELARRIDRNRVATLDWMDETRATPTTATCQGLVALKFLPGDALPDIVNAGFPFVAWLRCAPAGDDWHDFETRLGRWAAAFPLKKLAREIRSIRTGPNALGANLTLFWDDPNQVGHLLQLHEMSIGDH